MNSEYQNSELPNFPPLTLAILAVLARVISGSPLLRYRPITGNQIAVPWAFDLRIVISALR